MIINGHEIDGRMPPFKRWGRNAIRRDIDPKTQTRRTQGFESINENPDAWSYKGKSTDGLYLFYPSNRELHKLIDYLSIKCPYKPGEIRVMREPLKKDPATYWTLYADDITDVYDANGDHVDWRWKRDTLSQMFMPTEYGRTLCQIEDIRGERVQEISEEDAITEGSQTPCAQLPKSCQGGVWTERQQFSRIWDSINGPEAWQRNDWVFMYSFSKLR